MSIEYFDCGHLLCVCKHPATERIGPDWAERAAAACRELNPDYVDWEVEAAKLIRAQFRAAWAALSPSEGPQQKNDDDDLTHQSSAEKAASMGISAKGNEKAARGCHYGAPLSVATERCALVIRIGIQTLAHAVTYSDWANPYEDETGDYLRDFAITDAAEFAKDVQHAMLDEREDGSTPLSDFIDKMTKAAVDDGSMACEYEQRIKHGKTAPCETWAALSPSEGPGGQQMDDDLARQSSAEKAADLGISAKTADGLSEQ